MAQRIAITDRLQRAVSSLAETASLLSSKGWAEANAGNISVEVTELLPPEASGQVGDTVSTAIPHPELQGRSFLITGAGTRMRDVAREAAANCCLLRVADDLNGYQLLWGGVSPGFRPTSELPAHLAIHAFLRRSGRPERAFLHTHPHGLVSLTHHPRLASQSALGRALAAVHPEVTIAFPGGVGLAPYRPPASQSLAEATVQALEGHRAVVWEKHGCAAVGADPLQAFDLVDILEKAAQVYLTCLAAGFQPEGLTDERLSELRRLFPPSTPTQQ